MTDDLEVIPIDTDLDNSLSAEQLAAITLLCQGATQREAALVAGCHERTLRNWLKKPEFLEVLKDRQGEVLINAARSVSYGIIKASRTLQELMDDKDVSASVRQRAAAALLQSGIALLDVVELGRRLDSLENTLAEMEIIGDGSEHWSR